MKQKLQFNFKFDISLLTLLSTEIPNIWRDYLKRICHDLGIWSFYEKYWKLEEKRNERDGVVLSTKLLPLKKFQIYWILIKWLFKRN